MGAEQNNYRKFFLTLPHNHSYMSNNSPSNSYRCELQKKIPEAAMMLFMSHGVRAVKMDDIARHLSISKRTLYEIFHNKEDVLFEGIRQFEDRNSQELQQFAATHDDVMQIIIQFYRMKISQLGTISPLFFQDLHRYTQVEKFFQSVKAEKKKSTLKFFQRGVDEGYFLPYLNYDIVIRLGDASLDYVMSTKMYEQYSPTEIFRNFVSVLLRGYCTEKGQRILDEAAL